MAYANQLSRAIAIADYILEEEGHSTKEAAKEFRISKDTVEKSINLLGSCAYFNHDGNEKELKIKYLKAKKMLKKVAARSSSNTKKAKMQLN